MRTLCGAVLLSAGVSAWAGTIDTVVGSGKKGYSGDGGPVVKARLFERLHCELDGEEALYVAEDRNHCVRKVDLKTGTITTVAGTGKKGYSGDGGPATKATFDQIYAVVISPEG